MAKAKANGSTHWWTAADDLVLIQMVLKMGYGNWDNMFETFYQKDLTTFYAKIEGKKPAAVAEVPEDTQTFMMKEFIRQRTTFLIDIILEDNGY